MEDKMLEEYDKIRLDLGVFGSCAYEVEEKTLKLKHIPIGEIMSE